MWNLQLFNMKPGNVLLIFCFFVPEIKNKWTKDFLKY